ncbi:MAG: hypothetical protein E7374_04000 [Clostridiales bacterium]|nr:hypothetical protein [Clostridiales bacterium]
MKTNQKNCKEEKEVCYSFGKLNVKFKPLNKDYSVIFKRGKTIKEIVLTNCPSLENAKIRIVNEILYSLTEKEILEIQPLIDVCTQISTKNELFSIIPKTMLDKVRILLSLRFGKIKVLNLLKEKIEYNLIEMTEVEVLENYLNIPYKEGKNLIEEIDKITNNMITKIEKRINKTVKK